MTKKEKDIVEIISKSIGGTKLNSEETELKQSWLQKNGNKLFFNKLVHYRKGTKEIIKDNRLDVESAFQKHLDAIKKVKRENRRLVVNRVLPYAAMIVLAIGVFSVITYLGKDNTVISQSDQWLASLEPGSQKAELVLADGQILNLDDKSETDQIKEKDGTLINNTGSSLVYDSKEKLKTEEAIYNSLLVPRGGEFQLELADGTKVWVNSETRLRYPTKFTGNERVVMLDGEAYFDVSDDKNRPFVVKTQGVDIRVLGTSFNVSSYNDEESIKTTLVEGSVVVMDHKDQSKNILLDPGYQAVYSKKERELKADKVNVDLYTSWKDGRFMFERSRLDDIMNKVSRWYDVKVFFQNNNSGTIRFSGSLKRYDNLDRLLSMIEKTNEVKFTIGHKIIQVEKVYKKVK